MQPNPGLEFHDRSRDRDLNESGLSEPISRRLLTCDDLVDVVDQEVEELVGILLHVVVELDWKESSILIERKVSRVAWSRGSLSASLPAT